MTKFIFITGGVVSSLGKGITTSSIGALLIAHGYDRIKFLKMDPYLNSDPGTMSPFEHGEVYVTKDGRESDLDLGNYERFSSLGITTKNSNITTGQINEIIHQKERRGDYLGSTVQIIPHWARELKEFIARDSQDYDFVLCEVGGVVGDIEAEPFLEAVRQFRLERDRCDTLSIHITLVPYLKMAKELKTKPTQTSVRELMQKCCNPDFVVCRTEHSLSDAIREKIAIYSNLTKDQVIEGIDMDSIYRVPLYYEGQGFLDQILKKVRLPKTKLSPEDIEYRISMWKDLEDRINATEAKTSSLTLSIVGKYIPYDDAYKSLVEAIKHASWYLGQKVSINWVNARTVLESSLEDELNNSDCVIVPGGFGSDGIDIKIKTIKYCREHQIPILGICLGMQLMVVEYLRNVLRLPNVVSSEWLSTETRLDSQKMKSYIVGVGFINEWQTQTGTTEVRQETGDLGGTMRLGEYKTYFNNTEFCDKIYDGKREILERHRHRYEVNKMLVPMMRSNGLDTVGVSHDGLPEVVSIGKYPYFIGCQYHPEFNSSPFSPNALFMKLLEAGSVKN